MTRSRVILIGIILALLAGMIFFARYAKFWKAEAQLQQSNFEASHKEASEYRKTYTITQEQYKSTFNAQYTQAKKDLPTTRHLQAHDRLILKYQVDTILYPVPDTAEVSIPDDDYTHVFVYSQNCLFTEIETKAPEPIQFKQYGEIEINTYTYLQRKKRWFWRLKWGKKGWEQQTKTTTPCGFEIKENTRYEIR